MNDTPALEVGSVPQQEVCKHTEVHLGVWPESSVVDREGSLQLVLH